MAVPDADQGAGGGLALSLTHSPFHPPAHSTLVQRIGRGGALFCDPRPLRNIHCYRGASIPPNFPLSASLEASKGRPPSSVTQ